jgi:hypothetical protein
VFVAPLVPVASSAAAEPRWSPPADETLLTAWAGASGLLLLYWIGAGALLQRRAAHWRRVTVHGRDVLVSDSTGPALLGTWRPQIVVPQWFMAESPATQRLILQHEEQHIAARDPLVLRAAMLLTLALPWNLPLWWQLRRLRQSIEMDCDARVLRNGATPSEYGHVLLAVTRRAGGMPATLIAMSGPASTLERRIRNLTPDPARHAVLRAVAALMVWMAGIGLAAGLEAPSLPERSAAAPPQAAPLLRAAAEPAPPASPPVRQADAARLPRLLPPPPHTPRSRTRTAVIEQAILTNHPELVNGPERDGNAFISVQIAPDDSVPDSQMQFVEAGDAAGLEAAKAAASKAMLVPESGQMLLFRGQQIAGGATVKSQALVSYRYLPPKAEAAGMEHRGSFPPADVRAVVEYYFPGAWNGRGSAAEGMLWLVLSQDGRVLHSGRTTGTASLGINAIWSEVPDLRLGQMMVWMGAARSSGLTTPLLLAWVAP